MNFNNNFIHNSPQLKTTHYLDRSYYKGHMDKIKWEGGGGEGGGFGWDGVEGWGEKAYNCN